MRGPLPIFAVLATLAAACSDNQTFPDPRPPYEAGPMPLSCLPNLDGRIDSRELEAAVGVPATWLVSPPGAERSVDLEGVVDAAGHRFWDWSLDLAEDRAAVLEAARPGDSWFVDQFPGAELVAPLDAAGTTLSVFSQDAQALWLHGVASTAPDPPEGPTLLRYDEPIALVRFPLERGASWTSTARVVRGTLYGLPFAGDDTYEVAVDATGRLELPHFTLTQAHRMRVTRTVRPAIGPTTVQRQVSFLFECLGEVARATSRPNEPADDFTSAVEVRRLGLADREPR